MADRSAVVVSVKSAAGGRGYIETADGFTVLRLLRLLAANASVGSGTQW